jgi:inner membrane protein
MEISAWMWLAAALVLGAAEISLPGAFMIWLAGAALVTGAFTALTGLGWEAQISLFAALSIVAILAGRAWIKRHPIQTSDSGLNRRADRLVGLHVAVCEAIIAGQGKVMVGDSPWLATGPDAPEGAQVRIDAVEGTLLRVTRVD